MKKREILDEECEFLRKQNTELKHLLLRYLPSEERMVDVDGTGTDDIYGDGSDDFDVDYPTPHIH